MGNNWDVHQHTYEGTETQHMQVMTQATEHQTDGHKKGFSRLYSAVQPEAGFSRE